MSRTNKMTRVHLTTGTATKSSSSFILVLVIRNENIETVCRRTSKEEPANNPMTRMDNVAL